MPVVEKIMVMCIPWQETRYSVFTDTQWLCTVQVLVEPRIGYSGKNAIYPAVIILTFSVTH